MNQRAKKMWERHYTALGWKNQLEVLHDAIALSRIILARRRIEILLRKG